MVYFFHSRSEKKSFCTFLTINISSICVPEDRNGRRHIVTSAPPPGFGAGLLPKPLPYKDEKDALFAPHHQQQPARTPPSVFAPKPEENGFSFRNLVDFNLDGLEDRLPSSPGAESGEDGVKNIAYNGYHYGGEPGKYDDGSQVYGFIDQKSKAKKVKTRYVLNDIPCIRYCMYHMVVYEYTVTPVFGFSLVFSYFLTYSCNEKRVSHLKYTVIPL